MMYRFLVPLCMGMTAACALATPALAPESINFAPSLQVDLAAMERRNNGVYVRDLEEGDGPQVRRGRRIAVHYTGYLSDGTRFEQVAPPAAPIEFSIGDRTVIPGWETGLLGMRAGGERQLVVPPSQGYGARQVGRVPPHATLVFVIKLVSVR